jgi:hypothetical protein
VRITAVDVVTDSEARLGILTNISKDGLAFSYIGGSGEGAIEAKKPCTLALYELNGKALIENIPAKVICDRHKIKRSEYSFLAMKECYINFSWLPRHLARQLDLIIHCLDFPPFCREFSDSQ